MGIRRRGHGRDGWRLCAVCANAAERRNVGWQALSQARDHRLDDIGSYRAGDKNRARLFLFSWCDQRVWAWLRRAELHAAEHVVAAGGISLGRHRRDVLLYRSERRYV